MEPDEYLRQFLEQARDENGRRITQKALAEAIDVKQPTVAEWLSGRRPVPIKLALQLWKVYGLDPRKLSSDFAEMYPDLKRFFSGSMC